MTYTGHFEDGVVVLDEAVQVENGTPVEVDIRFLPVKPDKGASEATFSEYFAEVMGKAEDLPSDLSEQHDHYLYGVPKQ